MAERPDEALRGTTGGSRIRRRIKMVARGAPTTVRHGATHTSRAVWPATSTAACTFHC